MIKLLLLIIFAFVSQPLFSQVFVAENTVVRLNNEVDLSVASNVNNNAIIEGSGFFKLTGDNSQSLKGNGTFENLSVDKSGGTAEITEGNQDVFRSFEIHGGTLSPNARLTLKSNDTLTAQMGENSGGNIAGDIIFERFIPKSNRAYRYLSSPVLTSGSIRDNLQEGQNNTGTKYPADNINDEPGFGTHITGSTTGADGFDATLTGNPSFYNFWASTQEWNSISNTNINTLDKGESFSILIRGSRATPLNSNTATGPETTLRLTGNPTLLNFSKEIPLEENYSFVLLGNPYHATIDANLVLGNNPELNSNRIYVYDPSLNSRGGYATVELPAGTNSQGSNANQFLQAWQSVFVEVLNTEPTALNLSFTESDKATAEPQPVIFSAGTRINLKLQSENETIDGVSVKLEHGANSAVDQNDAKKLFNLDESLFIYSNANSLSIEERDFPMKKDTVRIRLDNKRKQEYQFVINGTNLSQAGVVFKDFYLDETYELQQNQELSVNYQVAEGEPDMRFGFILKPETLSSEEFTSKIFQIYPNPAEDVLNIQLLSSTPGDLSFEIYSLLGQKIGAGKLNKADQITNYDISSFSAGVYLIVLKDDNNLKETLKFIKI